MILINDHLILSSLKEFLNYKILQDLQAFRNRTVPLYNYSDKRLKSKSVYGSPFPGWVYDSSISGANVPSGIMSGGSTLLRSGAQGLRIDYKNGRVVMNSGQNSMTNGSGSVAVQDFNIYITSQPDEKLVFENNYESLPDLLTADSYLEPDSVVAPCIFVKFDDTNAKELALGGTTYSLWNIKIIAICRTHEQIVGIGHVVRNLFGAVFPLLDETPLNELNDVKSPPWNYASKLSGVSRDKMIFIEDSSWRYREVDSLSKKNPSLLLGIGRLELRKDG